MTEREAISFLGGDEEHIEEFVTQEVFDLKTRILKGTIVPQLLIKKAEKLSNISEALISLGFEKEQIELDTIELILTGRKVVYLIDFYRKYEQISSQLKLKLMQAFHPQIVAQILRSLAELEEQKLLSLAKVFNDFGDEGGIKLSDHMDSGVIISELKSSDLQDEILPKLNEFPTLKKEIGKSFKYCKFVASKKS